MCVRERERERLCVCERESVLLVVQQVRVAVQDEVGDTALVLPTAIPEGQLK